MTAIPPLHSAIRPTDPAMASLTHSAQAMEGLFLQQLFQAMRAGIPTDGLLARGPGEELFASMLDQALAERAAQQELGPRDLSNAIAEALRQRLAKPADTAP